MQGKALRTFCLNPRQKNNSGFKPCQYSILPIPLTKKYPPYYPWMNEYIELMEDLEDLAAVAELKNEETIPWEQVKKELIDNELL